MVVLTAGLMTSCSSSHTSGAPSAHPTVTHSSLASASAAQQLTARANGMSTFVVPIPSGYDGVTYDATGDIDFWTDSGKGWQEAAERTYPHNLATQGYPGTCGGHVLQVTGMRLAGMPHATYIVCGQFAGDGSAWDVVFSDSQAGWQCFYPQGQSLASIASPTVNNAVYAASFSNGDVETAIDTGVFSSAFSSGFPLIQDWRWSGTGFALASDNSLTAQIEQGPTDSSIAALPATTPHLVHSASPLLAFQSLLQAHREQITKLASRSSQMP
jgi:hypothetical protein